MGVRAIYEYMSMRKYPKEMLIQIFVKPSGALTNNKLSLKNYSSQRIMEV